MRLRLKRGMMVPLAIAIMLMLGIFALAVHTLSRQTYRGLERIDGFLRSVSVAEAGYSRVVARLEASPWEDRWFKGGSETASGTWEDGKYAYIIADAGGGRADLLVRGSVEGAHVMLYWLLQPDLASLAAHRRVRTTFFLHVDPATPLDVPGLGRIRTLVDDGIRERQRNRPWSDEHEKRIANDPRPGALPGDLELPGPPPPSTIPPLVDGQPPSPVDPRVTQPPVADPPFPSPPPPPPDNLVTPPTVLDLVDAREGLNRQLQALQRMLGILQKAVGGIGPDGNFKPADAVANIGNQQSSCCQTPPPDPLPPECASYDCQACQAAMAQFNAQVASQAVGAVTGLQSCIDSINGIKTDLDAAVVPPGPSESDAQGLLGRARSAGQCAGEATNAAQQLITKTREGLKGCSKDDAFDASKDPPSP